MRLESKVILAELKRLKRPNVGIDRGRQQSGLKRSVKSGDFVRPLIESLLSAHWVWSSRSSARSHSNPTAPFDILFLSPRTRAVNERELTPHWTCILLRRACEAATHPVEDCSHSSVSMMVEGCAKGVKYGLFVANAVILVGGIVVFSVGIWTLADRSFMERLLGSDLYVSSASILIATGIIVTIISFLGFLGAVKEIKCMLLTFFIILFMIFITMLVGGILGYVFRSEVDDRMHTEMLLTIKLYQNDTQVTDAWDAVQTHFQCCGLSLDKNPGYEVWSKQNAHFGGVYKIPATCCKTKDDGLRDRCQKDPNEMNAYLEGCYEKMKDFVERHAKIVGGIGVGIACLLLVGMALSCALFCLIK